MTRNVAPRRGIVLPLFALWIVILFCFIALAVDLGLMALARGQCQEAADAAALAGARSLDGRTTTGNPSNFNGASTSARTAAGYNSILGTQIDSATAASPLQVKVEIGQYYYDPTANSLDDDGSGSKKGKFTPVNPANLSTTLPLDSAGGTDGNSYSLVRVTVNSGAPKKFVFGQFFNLLPGGSGQTTFQTNAVATAAHRPRDVGIAVDLSGSMGSDTGWRQIFRSQGGRYDGKPSRTGTYGGVNDTIWPRFGHYSSTASWQARFESGVNTDNLTRTIGDDPACILDFYSHDSTSESVTPTVAFSSAGNTTNPCIAGDNPPYVNGSTSNYGATVNDVCGGTTNHGQLGNRDPYQTSGANSWKGFTRGPGYWGITFWMWPPNVTDNAKDWRQRFFRTDNYAATRVPVRDNAKLYSSGTASTSGLWRPPVEGSNAVNYYVDYDAIMSWIFEVESNAAGMLNTKIFPDRLRSGRVMYYSAKPDPRNATTGLSISKNLTRIYGYAPVFDTFENLTGNVSGLAPDGTTVRSLSPQDRLNMRFWKEYIDYVLMIRQVGSDHTLSASWENARDWTSNPNPHNSSPANNVCWKLLHGNSTGNPEIAWGSVRITDQDWHAGNYATNNRWNTDNPQRPPLQFWFGPLSMVDFCTNCAHFGHWNGNMHQAQMWIAKSAIDNALGNMAISHPNDYVTMAFYSHGAVATGGAGGGAAAFAADGRFNRIRAPLGPNFARLRGALWYPPAAMTHLTDTTQWKNVSIYDIENLKESPYARGLTHYTLALQLIYNQFSSNRTNELMDYSTDATGTTYDPGTQNAGTVIPGAPLAGALPGESGGLGRRGAQKIIIFESDGVPTVTSSTNNFVSRTNSTGYYRVRAGGAGRQELPASTTYDFISAPPPSGTVSNIMTVVNQILADEASGGFKVSARKPVLLHTLFFVSTENADGATSTLRTMQAASGTQEPNPTDASQPLADYKIIDGADADAKKIKLQNAFNRILNDGVQLSLIE